MEHATLASRLTAAFAEAVWPARCPLCGDEDLGDGLGCAEHRFETGLKGPRCGRCAAAIAAALPDGERCPACRARAPGFARVAALAEYRAAANGEWLLALKYGGRPDLAGPLGALLATRLALEMDAVGAEGGADGASAREAVASVDGITRPALLPDRPIRRRAATPDRRVLVPVPLHLARRIERGYDQAWLLARACAEESGIPALRILRRVRATPVQGALGTTSRAANVRGAFEPALGARFRARRLVGADAWLVDDVLTSGSTAAECARILRRLGARSVSVLCVARP